ncbi:MAG: hypothetical protein IJQ11_01705 [Bacteroidales bacterium]|nr:hypothetical protein [Bacteroidales bacterium]
MKKLSIIAALAMVSLFGTSACAQKKGENMNSLNDKKQGQIDKWLKEIGY